MTYDRAHFEAAHLRLRRAPLELTDADLAQLAIVDPALAVKGHEAQRQAQLAIVRQHTAPALQTKLAPAAPPSTLDTFLERHGSKAVTYRALNHALDEMQAGLVQAWKAQKIRIAELEQRIKEMESRPMLKYAGVWQSEATYQEGRLTTHQGGLWLATATTTGTPGTEGSGWRLVVKRGHA